MTTEKFSASIINSWSAEEGWNKTNYCLRAFVQTRLGTVEHVGQPVSGKWTKADAEAAAIRVAAGDETRIVIHSYSAGD